MIMGMCKGCGVVFSALEMNEGFCKTCDTEEIRKEVEINGNKNSSLINLKKENEIKNVTVGFSWLFLLFGVFYPLIKGDFKNTLIIWGSFIFIIILSKFYAPLILLFGILYIWLSFTYNKFYIKSLLKKGFLPENKNSENALIKNGIKF
jgi:hypothetical protein